LKFLEVGEVDNAGAGQNLELLILISGGQRSMENKFFFFNCSV